LPDGIVSNQKYQFEYVNIAVFCNERYWWILWPSGLFYFLLVHFMYVHWVYFMSIGYILCPLGIFYVHWVYISRFGIL
jgi:hypothetical protein